MGAGGVTRQGGEGSNVDSVGVLLAQHLVLLGEERLTLQVGAADLKQEHRVTVLAAHGLHVGLRRWCAAVRDVVLRRRRSRCRAT